jgi:hypothetical protein
MAMEVGCRVVTYILTEGMLQRQPLDMGFVEDKGYIE